MVDDGLEGAPDGTNRPVRKSAALEEPESAGPGGHPGDDEHPYRGGQSSAGYRGPGKLGDRKIEGQAPEKGSAQSD